MDEAIKEIVAAIKAGEEMDSRRLDKLLRALNRKSADPTRRIAKRRLLPFYLKERAEKGERWKRWAIDEATDDAIICALRAKPRRTASGVATITVLTKPHPCASDCIYCPNDVRMPKSYLFDEPACQRAERCFFDPYLQVASRLRVLADMGHNTDKIELIVLGGTWSEYPRSYQIWFIKELFRALNDYPSSEEKGWAFADALEQRRNAYHVAGMTDDPDDLFQRTCGLQQAVDEGSCSYNAAIGNTQWGLDGGILRSLQQASFEDLFEQHRLNESGSHRVVGLAVESRPDMLTHEELTHLRRLGCTKIQMGIQSIDPSILAVNARVGSLEDVERAFALLREFGFKSHVHIMVNLLGSTPASDKEDFRTLVEDERFRPDEVKLYPCALVKSAQLTKSFANGEWSPYTEEELLDVLSSDVLMAPPYLRISRMIRDISSKDILVGNKKTNLRQLVEQNVGPLRSQEMRMREIATNELDASSLHMETIRYRTSNTEELFLQWVDDAGHLAGFLRLSLPQGTKRDAMIREVHIYGKVARLHETKEGSQHLGLGKALVEEACRFAQEDGRRQISVISAVGTRNYYRALGFMDGELYQRRPLP